MAVAGGEPGSSEQADANHERGFVENPMFDSEKMGTSVEHANRVTRTYGIEIMSINVISAVPEDANLTKSLASGAVAAAEALQAETAARGQANAVRIAAEAEAARVRIEAKGLGEAEIIKADSQAEGIRKVAAALNDKGGQATMGQALAEKYVNQMAEMAKHSKMMIVPGSPGDINGVLTSALGISGHVAKLTGQ